MTKDLLRVSRAGGGYHPQFAGREHRPLAAKAIGTYQGHVDHTAGDLEDALTDLEREAEDFKLLRGFARLLEHDAAFETRAPVDPERARRSAFEAAESVGVVTVADREAAIDRAASGLAVSSDAIETSLFADLDDRQILTSFDSRWSPEALIAQYNLSLAQTALFDATEIRVRSVDPKGLVSAVKRLGLLYEVEKTPAGRELVVTGPTGLFRATRRYGTQFARLLRSVAKTDDWTLSARIDDRGTERELRLSAEDPIRVPGVEPLVEDRYDSGVEADFAARFAALDLDWELVREPEPLAAGASVMIPDFAFDYRFADFRVFFEIMGFWTPEYVETKLSKLDTVEDVELLVAVDESLGAGEAIEARDHRAIQYSGTVRIKDVRDALRRYEADLETDSAADLPDELEPEADVLTLADLAEQHGVSESAIEDREFPEHELIGRTLVRPDVLAELADRIEDGMEFATAETRIGETGIDDASTVLAELGYRVVWDGLSGGTVRER
nr:DUF790 family protein [Natranaeroarchaeum aerophilus]